MKRIARDPVVKYAVIPATSAVTDDLQQQLMQFIVRCLPDSPRLSDAAKALHMTNRSLQRALQHSDTSFRQLVSQCRYQLAVRYLAENRLSLQQIAFSLGFEEQSSFQKAFKSWQDCSPGVFRQRKTPHGSGSRHYLSQAVAGLQVNYGVN